MNQNSVENLLQMAAQAESLERDWDGSPPSNVPSASPPRHRPHRHRRLAGAIATLGAIGAGLAIALLAPVIHRALWPARPAAQPGTPDAATTAVNAAGAPSTMLVALYRAATDAASTTSPTFESCPKCWCLARWTPQQNTAALADHELVSASFGKACVPEPAEVIVIGLSGPANALPTSDDQALSLAMCVLDTQASRSPTQCIDDEVEVRIASWKK